MATSNQLNPNPDLYKPQPRINQEPPPAEIGSSTIFTEPIPAVLSCLALAVPTQRRSNLGSRNPSSAKLSILASSDSVLAATYCTSCSRNCVAPLRHHNSRNSHIGIQSQRHRRRRRGQSHSRAAKLTQLPPRRCCERRQLLRAGWMKIPLSLFSSTRRRSLALNACYVVGDECNCSSSSGSDCKVTL